MTLNGRYGYILKCILLFYRLFSISFPLQDWERSLQNQEGPVEQIRLSYAKLGMHSPQAESKIDFINQKWDQMITLGNTYAER